MLKPIVEGYEDEGDESRSLVRADDEMITFPGLQSPTYEMPLPWLHSALVIVLTGLLASSPSSLSATECWLFSPTRCSLWVDGACVPKTAPESVLTLQGELLEYESRASGLFSVVHAPFLCLAMQVLCCALSLKTALLVQSEATVQIMKHVSILLLVAYGVLFLFMQSVWSIPTNNLFFVELIYVLAVLFVGTYSLKSGDHAPLIVNVVSAILTYPLLAVATLVASGEDDTVAHLTVFFSLGLACFAFLAMAIEYDSARVLGFLSTFWLCLVPFVVRCCVRLHHISEWEFLTPWGVASLVLLLVFYLLVSVLLTMGTHQIWPFHDQTRNLLVFQYFDFVIKATLSLLIVIGYF